MFTRRIILTEPFWKKRICKKILLSRSKQCLFLSIVDKLNWAILKRKAWLEPNISVSITVVGFSCSFLIVKSFAYLSDCYVDGCCIGCTCGKSRLCTAILGHNCQFMFWGTIEGQGSSDRQPSGNGVHSKCLFWISRVHDTVVNLSIDSAICIFRFDESEYLV